MSLNSTVANLESCLYNELKTEVGYCHGWITLHQPGCDASAMQDLLLKLGKAEGTTIGCALAKEQCSKAPGCTPHSSTQKRAKQIFALSADIKRPSVLFFGIA